jgi:hypothetical protein
MALRLAELEGASPAVLPEPEALSRWTTELVADLEETAKATALEKLGQGQRAFGIAPAGCAAGWRARLVPWACRSRRSS